MSIVRHHNEWLSLIDISGPFLSMPVLTEVFPEGLDKRHDHPELRARLHLAYEEWLDNQDGLSPDPAIHTAWVRFVLREALELDADIVRDGQELPAGLRVAVPEHHDSVQPTLAVVAPPGHPGAGTARLLVSIVPRHQDLDRVLAGKPWKASPATRMMTLLHGSRVRLGLVTNGERWMLVFAEPGQTSAYVTFRAELFFDEPLILRAFYTVLSARRFFGVPEPLTLEGLLQRSAEDQHEVTDQLGLQVRRAVEVLVQAIDRIHRERAGRDRGPGQGTQPSAPFRPDGPGEKALYDAAVFVMMRLVFLLAAEERKLLLLGDPFYDQHYAVSTLRAQLQEAADQHGDEVLRRRYDAWSRLLALFRAVHGGIGHEDLRLPAYGGTLFDPDRFPFLEGRPEGTSWRTTPAAPLPIDNLTVLDLLSALQLLEVRAAGGPVEARRVSFRALDVEQIGHVYEGLLDHTAVRADGAVLSLRGASGREPEVAIDELLRQQAIADGALIEYVHRRTGRAAKTVQRSLEYRIPADEARVWMRACEGRRDLYDAVSPWAGLIRRDAHGMPVIYPDGAVYVTEGVERRATGTHYTPSILTAPMVRHALDPLVYIGPAEGQPTEKWILRPAREILRLRICDMAMGSGAFLVQTCRYLAARLEEAWTRAEADAGGRLLVTPDGDLSRGDPAERPLPRDPDERLALARRVWDAAREFGRELDRAGSIQALRREDRDFELFADSPEYRALVENVLPPIVTYVRAVLLWPEWVDERRDLERYDRRELFGVPATTVVMPFDEGTAYATACPWTRTVRIPRRRRAAVPRRGDRPRPVPDCGRSGHDGAGARRGRRVAPIPDHRRDHGSQDVGRRRYVRCGGRRARPPGRGGPPAVGFDPHRRGYRRRCRRICREDPGVPGTRRHALSTHPGYSGVSPMIILHTSDLHGRYSLLEDRRFDVWVDTGDFFPDTAAAYRAAGPWEFAEMQRDYQSRWWDEVGHVVVDALAGRPVVLVGGNHDFADLAERLGTRYVAPGEPVVVDGVRFAGHRLVPPLNGMYAGESGDAERRDAARAALADRPDVLITHVPPAGILSGPWGCRPLATAVLSAAYGSHAPALHLFGHVHHAAGVETVGPTTFVNSAQTARYLAVSI